MNSIGVIGTKISRCYIEIKTNIKTLRNAKRLCFCGDFNFHSNDNQAMSLRETDFDHVLWALVIPHYNGCGARANRG